MHTSIRQMNYSMELRQRLVELACREMTEQFNKRRNQEQFTKLLGELKTVDPTWEAWYDNDNNIPTFITWADCKPVLTALANRIAEVKAELGKESNDVSKNVC